MKKTFKIIAALLAFALVFGFVASCDTADDAATDTGSSESTGSAGGESSSGSERPAPVGKDIYNDPIRIAQISISTAGPVNRLYRMALEEQLVRYPNVTLDIRDAEYNPTRQITLIQEAITQGYDAILLEAMDPFALNDAVAEAEDAGIPVITLNAAQPLTLHSLHMAGADHATGWTSGELMDEMTRGQSNRTAIVLDCPDAFKPAALMGTGFQDYIATTDITELQAIGIENWSTDNARVAMADMLTRYGPGEITMVYCANDDIAGGAMLAIEAAGRTGDILVWGFQVQPTGFEGIQNGQLAGSMFSDTYVQYSSALYFAMYFIASGINSRTAGYTETPMVEQPMLPVTIDNVETMMAVSRWYS